MLPSKPEGLNIVILRKELDKVEVPFFFLLYTLEVKDISTGNVCIIGNVCIVISVLSRACQ